MHSTNHLPKTFTFCTFELRANMFCTNACKANFTEAVKNNYLWTLFYKYSWEMQTKSMKLHGANTSTQFAVCVISIYMVIVCQFLFAEVLRKGKWRCMKTAYRENLKSGNELYSAVTRIGRFHVLSFTFLNQFMLCSETPTRLTKSVQSNSFSPGLSKS